ncbi:MAG: hypothetical protein ABJX32_18070 [Tateyamaria sp.]
MSDATKQADKDLPANWSEKELELRPMPLRTMLRLLAENEKAVKK